MGRLWTWVQSPLEWLTQSWSKGGFEPILWLISGIVFACTGWILFEILAWLFSKARTRIAYKLSPCILWICASLAALGSGWFALLVIGSPPELSCKILPWGVSLLIGPLIVLCAVRGLLAERARMIQILDCSHSIP